MSGFVRTFILDCIFPYRGVDFASNRSEDFNSESINNDEHVDKFHDFDDSTPTPKQFHDNLCTKYQENNKNGDSGFFRRILFPSLINSFSSCKIKTLRPTGSSLRKIRGTDNWNEDRIDIQNRIGDGAQVQYQYL